MRKFGYLLECLFVVIKIVSTQKCDLVNVKTILWKPYDSEKVCWSRNDELLLYARRVAQDLLPTKIPSDLGQLLQYFEIVWEAASKISPNVTQSAKDNIIKPAIGDAIGGYLQSVALPFATEAYYAGTVDYNIIKGFYDLQGKIKVYLDTDGGGWAAPCDLSQMATKVVPIDFRKFPDQSDPSSCQKLHIPMKDDGTPAIETKIEMPLLDDLNAPLAVIVPFKGKHLYSIISPSSSQILVEYYDLAMRCIGKANEKTMKSFNTAYFNWLSSYILPHIQQLKTCPVEWYPGFGGAMRVVDTITRNGLTPPNEDCNYGIAKPPPKSETVPGKIKPNHPAQSKPPKNVSTHTKHGSWLPKFTHHSLPFLHLPTLHAPSMATFLLPLIVPLLGCLLIYLLYLLYTLCCLPLLFCMCCRRSLCRIDNKQQPLLTLYYRCLDSLNGLKKSEDEVPDYDSIRAASGVSPKSVPSSKSLKSNSCGMCQWLGKKEEKTSQLGIQSEPKKVSKKKKKKKLRRGGTDSDAPG